MSKVFAKFSLAYAIQCGPNNDIWSNRFFHFLTNSNSDHKITNIFAEMTDYGVQIYSFFTEKNKL